MGAKVSEPVLESESITKKSARILALLRKKFRIRARSLSIALAKAGPRLPPRIHRKAQLLVEAQRYAANPKLSVTLNENEISEAFREVQMFLLGIDQKDQRIGAILSLLGAIVFNLMMTGVLLVLVLRWRGYL